MNVDVLALVLRLLKLIIALTLWLSSRFLLESVEFIGSVQARLCVSQQSVIFFVPQTRSLHILQLLRSAAIVNKMSKI